MSKKSEMLEDLSVILVTGEEVLFATAAQPRATRSQFAAEAAVAAVASVVMVAASAFAPGLLSYREPVWLVTTSHRVLMLEYRTTQSTPREVVFSARRDAIGAIHRVRLNTLAEVTLTDRAAGVPLIRLNLGWQWGNAKRAAAAIMGASSGVPGRH